MILVDYSQVAIASIMAQTRGENTPDEDLVRHIILNNIRLIRNKFKNDYGEIVLCCDAGNYWRKDIFPHYKASRKTKQQKSDFDWNALFNILGKVREEIREFFPYKVLNVERCEADDVIATIAKRAAESFPVEDVLIVSSDKDFQQLQKHGNVKQWNPIKKAFVICPDPEKFLQDLIIRGDSGDGVPNSLSDDDCFVVEGKRQKPLTKKALARMHDAFLRGDLPPENRPFIERNEKLVDFENIPEQYELNIISEFDKSPKGDRGKLFNYFVAKRLRVLIENIQEY